MHVGVMDLDEVRAARGGNTSRCIQSTLSESIPRVWADIEICRQTRLPLSKHLDHIRIHLPEEEIENGPSLWMWDYLRRSGARGYFLPLSGGADSAAVASSVASMARMVFFAIQKGN